MVHIFLNVVCVTWASISVDCSLIKWEEFFMDILIYLWFKHDLEGQEMKVSNQSEREETRPGIRALPSMEGTLYIYFSHGQGFLERWSWIRKDRDSPFMVEIIFQNITEDPWENLVFVYLSYGKWWLVLGEGHESNCFGMCSHVLKFNRLYPSHSHYLCANCSQVPHSSPSPRLESSVSALSSCMVTKPKAFFLLILLSG